MSLKNYFLQHVGGLYETMSLDNKTAALFGTLRSSTLLVSLALIFLEGVTLWVMASGRVPRPSPTGVGSYKNLDFGCFQRVPRLHRDFPRSLLEVVTARCVEHRA